MTAQADTWPLEYRSSRFPIQRKVLLSQARVRVIESSRNVAKTSLGLTDLVMNGLRHPGMIGWYLGETYGLARKRWFGPTLDYLPARFVADVNRSELRITLVGGSQLWGMSIQDVDRLRGLPVDEVFLDEAQEMPVWAIEEVIEQNLQKPRPGWEPLRKLFVVGTPKGLGTKLHELFERGQPCNRSGAHLPCAADRCEWTDHESWHLDAYNGGILPLEEVERSKRQALAKGPTAHRIWRREWLGDAEAFVGQVFGDAWDPHEHVVSDLPPRDRVDRVVVGVDWGFAAEHAGVFSLLARQPLLDERGHPIFEGEGRSRHAVVRWHYAREVWAEGQTIESYWIPRLLDLDAWSRENMGRPIDAVHAPDDRPDGVALVRRASDGRRWRTVPEERGDAFGKIVCLAQHMEARLPDKHPRFVVHSSCEAFRREVASYRWEQTSDGAWKEKPVKANDNALDAVMCALHGEQERRLVVAA